MSRVLLIADHDGKTLNTGIARSVACARKLGNVHVAVFHAPDADAPCGAAAKLDGVSRVLSVSNPANTAPLAAVLAPQIAKLAAEHEGGYDYVLAPSTTFGKDVLPRVAALLGVPQVSDLMEVIDARTFKRPIYAGNVITTVRVPEGIPVLATVRIASFPSVEAGSEAIVAASVAVELPTHTRYLGLEDSGGGDRPDLQSAMRVVAGGRGVGSKENFEIIFKLADKLGRRGGREPRGRGRRLRAERHAGRPDGQDHRARPVLRDRHLRRDSAHDGHQGCRLHRRHQQGRRCADLRGGRFRARGRPVPDPAGAREGARRGLVTVRRTCASTLAARRRTAPPAPRPE
jgi:electron transfer flavoprotein alpha subunit